VISNVCRIASNGDSANKISTYQIASLCSSPHPFSPNPPTPVLIAAPITTFDLTMESGREIVIEQRPGWEACTVRGRVVDIQEMAKNGFVSDDKGEIEVKTVLVTPMNTRAYNPFVSFHLLEIFLADSAVPRNSAFDVTPACLIDGIVTEVGVAIKKDEIYDLRTFVAQN
jgi:methylthioribose-1-phosphate isomerase